MVIGAKLIAEHKKYEIDYRNWTEVEAEYVEDDLDLPITSLEEAVCHYPRRAIRILFQELGLPYNKIKREMRRIAEFKQRPARGISKREPEEKEGGRDKRIRESYVLGFRSKSSSERDDLDVKSASTTQSDDE